MADNSRRIGQCRPRHGLDSRLLSHRGARTGWGSVGDRQRLAEQTIVAKDKRAVTLQNKPHRPLALMGYIAALSDHRAKD